MLHPSYNDLIKAINQTQENEEQKVKSRYSVVIAASKRARQLIDGAEAYVKDGGRKPLSIAVDEIFENKVTIAGDDDLAEEEINVTAADPSDFDVHLPEGVHAPGEEAKAEHAAAEAGHAADNAEKAADHAAGEKDAAESGEANA